MLDDVVASTPGRQERADEFAGAVLSGEVALEQLDDLVRSAALATWSPVALVSVITDRQVTVSAGRLGGDDELPARGEHVAFQDSVCVLALRGDGHIRITDARHDDRVATIPAAVAGVFASYLGAPLHAASGDLVGVLCVYDSAPRHWSEAEERDLDDLAARVSAELRRIVAEFALSR